MQSRFWMIPVLATCSLGGLVLLNVAPAFAQGQPIGRQMIVRSLEFQQTDVREALRQLFKEVGVSYTISAQVQGGVTVSMRNVPFDTALQNLTRQVDATYRIEGGVYQIVPRDGEAQPEPGVIRLNPSTERPGAGPYMVVDGNFLFVMHEGVVDKIDKRSMKLIGTTVLSKGR